MQSDGVKFIETQHPNLPVSQLEIKLNAYLKNIYSICKQTGKENTFLITRELLEEALKLGVDDHQRRDERHQTNRTFSERKLMDIESQGADPQIFDKISQKIGSSFITLSNFGEMPFIGFGNQAREMTVSYERNRGILVTGKQLIENSIDRYHKMRFLIKNSGNYVYQHDLEQRSASQDPNLTVIHEIGTMFGNRGNYTIFGLIFMKGKK